MFEAPVIELLVDRSLHGVRIDSFLVKHFRNYTAYRMQRIVRAGGAWIDFNPATEIDRVHRGQTVQIRLLEPPDRILAPDAVDIPVLYEDPWMMAVVKPAGLISHPAGEVQHKTLANVVQDMLDRRGPLKGLMRPGIVHRLDRQTSGVMVVALTHDAHARLALSFEESRVSKTYIALVEGRLREQAGMIDAAIGRSPTGKHVLMSCRPDALEKRPAKTKYEVIERFANHTLVRATPFTGRNHQIRVHFSHLGHPLVGDEFYEAFDSIKLGSEELLSSDEPRAADTGLPLRRHALHAHQLEIAHPVSNIWMQFQAPLPEDFAATLVALRAKG